MFLCVPRWHRDVTCLWGNALVQGQGNCGPERTSLVSSWIENSLGSGHQPAPPAFCSLIDHTYSLWPLVLRSQRQVTIASWMVPGPSTSPGSRRVTLASILAGLRTRPEVPRGTSILPCSVSEDHVPNSQACVSRKQGSQRDHHRPRPYPQEPTKHTPRGSHMVN